MIYLTTLLKPSTPTATSWQQTAATNAWQWTPQVYQVYIYVIVSCL